MAGVAGRSGRKSKAEEMGLQELLDECITPAARRKLFLTLLKDAHDKDKKLAHEAKKLLLAYLYGTPRQSLQLSGDASAPLEVRGFNYGAAVADITRRPEGDFPASGDGQGDSDGPAVGKDPDGG